MKIIFKLLSDLIYLIFGLSFHFYSDLSYLTFISCNVLFGTVKLGVRLSDSFIAKVDLLHQLAVARFKLT